MRKQVQMTYRTYKTVRGFKGHWAMNYIVDDVIDLSTKEVICSTYTFKESTIFKDKGFKSGDILEMSINVEKDDNGKVKLSYYKDIKKVGTETDGVGSL